MKVQHICAECARDVCGCGPIFRRTILAIGASFLLVACSDVPQTLQLAADPLMDAPDTPSAFATAGNKTSDTATADNGANSGQNHVSGTAGQLTSLEVVHLLVQDSQAKCSRFVNSLYAETAATGLTLDTLGTVASALATVFTPTPVTHSLSAVSTIFSGARSSFSTEYLNSLAISHVAQAIQATYGANMQKYIAYLDDADPAKIDVFAERSTILSYHAMCSLASAEGSITTSLQPGAQILATQPISVTYTVGNKPTLGAVTTALVALINANASFKSASITASSSASGVISFAMQERYTFTATTVPASGHVTATVSAGPPETLTIGGTLTAKDTITISAALAVDQTTAVASQPPVAEKPLAGISGSAAHSQ